MGLSRAQNAECLQATEVLQIEVKCNLSRAKHVRQLAHQFTFNSYLFNRTYLLYKWTINKLHCVSTRDLSAKAKAKLNLANQEIASFVLNLTTKIMVNYITQLFKHDGWIIPRLIHTSGMVTNARALQGDSLFIDRKLLCMICAILPSFPELFWSISVGVSWEYFVSNNKVSPHSFFDMIFAQ